MPYYDSTSFLEYLNRATRLKVSVLTLELTSPTLPKDKTISFDLTDKNVVESLAKNPINIKEGVEYSYVPCLLSHLVCASQLWWLPISALAPLSR